jgi:hypothetical protein
VRLLGYATFGVCVAVLTFGRKIERNLEYAMWILMAGVFGYLIFVDVTMVSAASWRAVLGRFVSFGALPTGGDWVLLGGFAAYSGLGGVSNAFMTHWMRDKGFGMGATVGYIPAATGDHVPLAPHGNVFVPDARSHQRWREWFRYVYIDQWLIFAVGSIGGMLLTTLITFEFVTPGTQSGGWAVADLSATAIAARHGQIFWYLTLRQGSGCCSEHSSETPMAWSEPSPTRSGAEARVRESRGHDVRRVYYSVMAVFVVWGCIALNLAQPLTLIIIGCEHRRRELRGCQHPPSSSTAVPPPSCVRRCGVKPCWCYARCLGSSPPSRSQAGSSSQGLRSLKLRRAAVALAKAAAKLQGKQQCRQTGPYPATV